jgi:cytochrome b
MFKVRVWDLPTRLFHWALALCVLALAITGTVGGEWMVWHFRCGYGVLTLLIFRSLWGFAGGHWSRWSAFRLRPSDLLACLRRPSETAQPGHSPLGSLSSLALLVVLSLQAASGLISDDEIATAGPFVPWVSSSLSAMATHWHTETGKLTLLFLVVLHVLAIWFYRRFKQIRLTHAMLTGDQVFPHSATASRDDGRSRLRGLLLWCVAVGLVTALIQCAP